jgi:putative peptidoglycan lipid II flippase
MEVSPPPDRSRSIGVGGAALIVSASILLSRLLGLLRETILAALLGLSSQGDFYRDAFVVPDFLNYLLAGGFLSITLIPILARRIESGDESGLQRDFAIVLRWLAAAIVVLTALTVLTVRPLVNLLFPRLNDGAVVEVARLTRIVLPAQIFFVLGGLLMAYQYAHRRFLIPALAPLIYNLGIIAGGLIGRAGGGSASAEGFIWGALIGAGAGNFALQWWGARKAGWRWARAGGRVDSGRGVLREYLLLALPLMIGQSVTVLDEQFPRLFGQLAGEGGTAALSLARMLNMLPVGIIAQAAGVAAFPFLARLVAGGRAEEADQQTTKAASAAAVIAFAVAALVWATALPLVRLVYRWGAFEEGDVVTVASLLAIFALAIPAWAVHQIVSRWFYAHRRMWLPVVTGTVATVLAIPVTLLAFDRFGIDGIAMASSLVMWAYTVALVVAWSRTRASTASSMVSLLVRLAIAGLVAAVAGRLLIDRIYTDSLASALLSTFVTALATVLVYVLVVIGLGLRQQLPGKIPAR